MREQLNTDLGFYRPTFFKMQVNTNANLSNLNTLADKPSAIYLHEYIHFLQDVTTTYGYANISTIVDYIKYVNAFTRNGASREFTVPVTLRPSPSNDVYFNEKLKREYIGTVEDINTVTVVNVTTQNKTLTLKNVIIDYHDSQGQLSYYHFGSHAIIESMAYFIENLIYPNVLGASPDFPYKAAHKVILFEYPALLHNPLNLLALCDASLMMFNPGEFFFTMLTKMKKEGYLPSIPENIYNYCFTNTSFNFNGATNFNQLLLLTSYGASQQLCDYFTTDTFGDNSMWINYTISSAVDIRISNPYFMLQIARGGKIQSNIPFMSAFKKLGTPMVSNLKNIGTFFSPLQLTHNINPECLWVISQIYSIYIKPLKDNKRKCELKLWCKESCKVQGKSDPTDSNCYNSPWLKAKESILCPFATVWVTWGMENEIPK